jgi:hypothetical protein
VSKQNHNSFTLRVPTDFYLELASKAQSEGIPLNQLSNRLLRLGMGKHVEVDDAIRTLLLDRMVEDPALREAVKAQVNS